MSVFYGLSQLFIPLGICVVLPVLILWLIVRKRMNQDNVRKEIVLAALDKNPNVDIEEFIKKMNSPQKSRLLKSKLLDKLLIGSIFSIFAVALFVAEVVLGYMGGVDSQVFIPINLAAIPSLAIGIAFLINYFVGRKMLAKEMETEADAE